MARKTSLHPLVCSFCGKPQSEVSKMIAGPSVYICNECVQAYKKIIEKEALRQRSHLKAIARPEEIKNALDEYVIGQDLAKKTLSVAVYNHYKRLAASTSIRDVEIKKSNILLIGPTGTGKTLLAQTLARILRVPFAIADATALTEAGYVGEDVENIILALLQNADYDIERAMRGIIYIDEIDKIARRTDMNSGRDVSGEGVQQALLKVLEGTRASVPPKGGRKHTQQEFISIDTTNILFICGGTFSGLDKIIMQRVGSRALGFGARNLKAAEGLSENSSIHARPEDLLKYGFIPEFIGRIPILSPLHELSENELLHILTEPKNALTKQYQKLFAMDGVNLRFTEGALYAIVREAMKRKSGARGLRAIMETFMLDVMFDMPDIKNAIECIINKDVVLKKNSPELTIGSAQKHA